MKENYFFHYFYDVHPTGMCTGFDGKKLKKMIVSHPGDINKTRSAGAYEADIHFTKRYLNYSLIFLLFKALIK